MCHYPNLGSALDWLKICFNQWEVPVSEICVVIMSSVWNQWHGILKCQLFLQVIWQPVNNFAKFFPLSFPWQWKCIQPCRIMLCIMVWTVLVLHVQRKLKTTYRIQVLSEWHILIPKQEVQQSTWNKWENKRWKLLKINIKKHSFT